jgi:predicted nucleic acid-binding protein
VMKQRSIIYYALEKDERFGSFALEILQAIENGEIERGFHSSISFAEIIGGFKDEEVARKMEVLLSHFPNLTIVPFDVDAAQETAHLQRKNDLTFNQEVQMATAIKSKSDVLISKEKGNSFDDLLWIDLTDFINSSVM